MSVITNAVTVQNFEVVPIKFYTESVLVELCTGMDH